MRLRMNRRAVLKGMAAVGISKALPSLLGAFAAGCAKREAAPRAGFLTNGEFALLESVVAILLPPTSSPGGVEARVPFFIELVMRDCLDGDSQNALRSGLGQLDSIGDAPFPELSDAQKSTILTRVDQAAFANHPNALWFRELKQLALIGYFTSLQGVTKALNYAKAYAEYRGCAPYRSGDKALAKALLIYE